MYKGDPAPPPPGKGEEAWEAALGSSEEARGAAGPRAGGGG